MARWSSHRILFYAGLIVMLGSWAAASFGVMIAATLSSAYNIQCTYQPPPLTTPVECGRLAAQIGQAVTIAVVGGAVGLGGMVIAYVGHRGSRKQRKMPALAEPRIVAGAGPRGPK